MFKITVIIPRFYSIQNLMLLESRRTGLYIYIYIYRYFYRQSIKINYFLKSKNKIKDFLYSGCWTKLSHLTAIYENREDTWFHNIDQWVYSTRQQ